MVALIISKMEGMEVPRRHFKDLDAHATRVAMKQ